MRESRSQATILQLAKLPLATSKRLSVKFMTIADLILQMETAVSQNRLKSYFNKIITIPSLIVLDSLATAILDRLIHHSHIININCDSYRLKKKTKAGILPIKITNYLGLKVVHF